jgi:CheY-like chemotaxis protein
VTTADRATTAVLVIEDNAIAREGLAAVLRHHGYAVRTARHGRDGLDALTAGRPPDAILLDMYLPQMDGWHFLDWLKGTPFGSIPVIITTGGILTREWAETHGCAGFLKKPFDDEDLLAELSRCLDAKNRDRERPTLRPGNGRRGGRAAMLLAGVRDPTAGSQPHRRVRRILQKLGDTPEEVADAFRALGIRGVRNTVRFLNPVVRYAHTLVRDAAGIDIIARDRLRFVFANDDLWEVGVPEPVLRFLDAFHRGDYPDLELPVGPDGVGGGHP